MNAIEQLKSVLCNHDGKCCIAGSEEDRAIVDRALQALAQPEQEPVQFKCTVIDDAHPNGIPLEQWAKPQQRTWVGLTDDELSDIWFKQSTDWMEFARAIEAAHGIGDNT